MKKLFVVLTTLLILAGCKENVSDEKLEELKSTAKANALFNANVYRAQNPVFKDYSIVAGFDSTQTKDCPNGDGWITEKFMTQTGIVVPVKCSTVSESNGCMTDAELKGKENLASQDGQCNSDITTITKIAK